MEYMQAAVLTAFGGPESFKMQTVPKPLPEPNQVLVRICATSVNPDDSFCFFVPVPCKIGCSDKTNRADSASPSD